MFKKIIGISRNSNPLKQKALRHIMPHFIPLDYYENDTYFVLLVYIIVQKC